MVQAKKQSIDDAYAAKYPGSATLRERAVKSFPSGVTHDARYMEPFPIYVTRAQGSRKWDVDGNEIIDYWSGHGALLLGHNHPQVTQAVAEQVQRGTHYGACHELELGWAELVRAIVPSAEVVKFLSSGTEATMMAMRLARAFTGREHVIKLHGHFHGWNDYATVAYQAPYEVPSSTGIPRAVSDTIIAVPHNDIDALSKAFESNPDVAAVILLAGGLGTDTNAEFLRQVNEVAHAHGSLVIYDEVITGFRYAAGGCQELYGVTPDITTLAKILAGGLPGGAVVARKDIMELLEFRGDPHWMRFGRISHPGTYNANPVSAAAGIACLEIVKSGEPQAKAAATAEKLRTGLAEALSRRGVPGQILGQSSIVGIRLNASGKEPRKVTYKLRAALLIGGVDISPSSIMVSNTHSDEDVDQTVIAFEAALQMLQAEGIV